jgi:chloramphenicol-sensitive protein RarD
VAQRVLWSLILITLLIAARTGMGALTIVLRNRRVMRALAVSAVMIATNWLTYVWAVNSGHVIAASLGYFLNPLVNVALGVLVLKERLRRGQTIALAVAALGVAILATAALQTLWISVTLAVSFAFYGLVRKVTPVAPMAGLGAETLLLTPLAFGWLAWTAMQGTLAFGQDVPTTALLIASGAVTTVPLVLFAVAAQRLPMATLGVLQYLAPTMQFLCGILLFGETLNQGQIVSFGLIWLGLILFAADSYRAARQGQRRAPAKVAGKP